MRIYSTVRGIKTEVEALFKNLTGKYPLSAVENDIVYGAIVDAMQIVLLEYGIENFTFSEQEETLTTVSGQNYVDLSTYAFKVIAGTMRIESEKSLLSLIDEQGVYIADPDLSETGIPTGYYYVNSGSVNVVRLGLWPKPDAAYTIKCKVHQYPEDNLTNFPANLDTAIKLKSKAMACLGLGIISAKAGFDAAYEDIMKQVKDSYQEDTPKHVGVSLQLGYVPPYSERHIP